ncbi:unnamed protein product, partial [Didymodactylos carnosus]
TLISLLIIHLTALKHRYLSNRQTRSNTWNIHHRTLDTLSITSPIVYQTELFASAHRILINEKQNNNNNSYYNIIVPYHQQLPSIKQFLGEQFSSELLTNHRLVYTCSPNLGRLLTRSKYPPSFRLITPTPDPPPTTGCSKYYDPICVTCLHLTHSSWFLSTSTNKTYNIPYP